MRISTSLWLPAFAAAASATHDANVYLFQGDEWPNTSTPPTLSPVEARLIFAQRLGAARYHDLQIASEETLSHVSKFGGQQGSLFNGAHTPELVLIVDGVSPETAQPLLDSWSSFQPAFKISNPPSMEANRKLEADLIKQSDQPNVRCDLEDAINLFEPACSNGRSIIRHVDLTQGDLKLNDLHERLVKSAKNGDMNVLVVLMPESSRLSESHSNSYGVYQMPRHAHLDSRQVEEPMTDLLKASPFAAPHVTQVEAPKSSSNSTKKLKPVPALCHSSLENCESSTNGCSGHGACYNKYPKGGRTACFTCGCKPQNETFTYGDNERKGFRINYWGGAACQKKDVSGPFWLIATFSVVMVGLISWAIGMLFSIGEEKLPGVIGAGVSSNKAR